MTDDMVNPLETPAPDVSADGLIDTRPAVLIADDSAEIRQLVGHRLRARYRVLQATDGRAALEQFARYRPAVVLLDLDMPIMDGYATAAAIRRREDGRTAPIIAMTGEESAEARRRATMAGCTAYLTKPVPLAAIAAAVDAALLQPVSDAVSIALPAGTRQGESHPPVPLDIDPLLADLVPAYVREKRRQAGDLRHFIANDNMDRVLRLAHDMKGTGTSYGIPDVTRIGRALEAAGRERDADAASRLVNELDRLLAQVQQQLGC